jgi:hypothetical protein
MLGQTRSETQSESIEIKDLKYKKSMIVIVTIIQIIIMMKRKLLLSSTGSTKFEQGR